MINVGFSHVKVRPRGRRTKILCVIRAHKGRPVVEKLAPVRPQTRRRQTPRTQWDAKSPSTAKPTARARVRVSIRRSLRVYGRRLLRSVLLLWCVSVLLRLLWVRWHRSRRVPVPITPTPRRRSRLLLLLLRRRSRCFLPTASSLRRRNERKPFASKVSPFHPAASLATRKTERNPPRSRVRLASLPSHRLKTANASA